VTLRRLELGEEICVVLFSCRPDHVEDFLADSVTDPVVSHVDGLGPAKLDGVVGDPYGSAVVGIDSGGWLRISEAGKNNSLEVGVLGVDVKSGILGLGGGAADGRDGAADWEDDAVQDIGGVAGIAAVVETSCYGSGLLL